MTRSRTRAELLTAAIPTVSKLVYHKYGKLPEHDFASEELVQIGLTRICQHVDSWDAARCNWTTFVTYHATWGIQDEMRRFYGRRTTVHKRPAFQSLDEVIFESEGEGDIRLEDMLGAEDPALAGDPFFRESLAAAIADLYGKERDVAALRVLGADVHETAEVMGIKPDYASSLRAWAFAKLRRHPALSAYAPS
jgi:DNA-directed RNA polymerase specialized sigma24 family protein